MPIIIEGPPEPGDRLPPLWRRLLWFAGLGLLSTAAVAAAAYALRAALLP
ncbi:MAG: DUF2474 domain-containing protein [Pseudomonadota bacterium]|nr:DUF2474 domain-containing protein [Pseudomonadota bacterium]